MLAAFKRPRAYRFVSELPMTATGKKLHYQLREHGRVATPPRPAFSAREPDVPSARIP